MAKPQKERLREAYAIYQSVCSTVGWYSYEDDRKVLAFRKWVLKRERKVVKESKRWY